MSFTISYPKNDFCAFILRVLYFLGIDAYTNKYLVNSENYEDVEIPDIVLSTDGITFNFEASVKGFGIPTEKDNSD